MISSYDLKHLIKMGFALLALAASRGSCMAQGTWAALPPMPTARAALGAATGPDGKIYAIGGLNDSVVLNTFLNTVEAYDPSSNSWTTATPMPTPRAAPAVVTGPDGRIYAIGGANSSGTTGANEAYDTVSKQWKVLAPMPTARGGLAAAVGPDGRIYAIGGSQNGIDFDTVEAYDPHTDDWTTMTPLPTPAAGPSAATGLDGRIYVAGGAAENILPALSTVDAYDILHNNWTSVASLPQATVSASAANANGSIYVIGGISGSNGTILDTTQRYDVITNTWTNVAPMPSPRFSCACATGLNGRIYVVGGQLGSYPGGVIATAEAYSPPGPTVFINSPVNHAVVKGTVTVTGTITDVAPTGAWTLTCNGIQIGAGTGTSATVSWNTALWAEGSHTLSLKETDVAGNTGSSTVTVTVNNKGVTSVAITKPANGAIVRGTVIVTGAISDATPGTWTLTDNGAQIGAGSGASPSVSWNTTKVAGGVHKLELTEKDAAGHTGSAAVSVTVNNKGVTSIKITSPANGAVVKSVVIVTGEITDATPGTWALTCDGAQIGSGTGLSPRVSWNTTEWEEETHTLVLTETDAAGNKGSATITVIVGNP